MGRAIAPCAASATGRARSRHVVALPGAVALSSAVPSTGSIAGPGTGPCSRPPPRTGAPNTPVNVAVVAVRAPVSAVAVDVDIDVVAVPIAAIRKPRTDRYTGRKNHDRSGVRSLDHNDGRAVCRHIDHGRTR